MTQEVEPSAIAAADEGEHARLQRRTLRVVLSSQVLSGAGLAAGMTTGGLIARDMFGSDAYSGVPAAMFTLGSASAALLVGTLSQHHGRRVGLASGYALGAAGALGVVAGTALDSIALFLVALLIYGAGTATNLQARYAGADLARPDRRATAMSSIMVAVTLGAVAGPNLAAPMSDVADWIGVPPLAGVFVLAGAAYATAALVLHALLRPDPYLTARTWHARDARCEHRPEDDVSHMPGLVAGATVMVVIQMVMIAIMTMTPIHMDRHGHDLQAIGVVIGAHVGAMFLPSLVTGMLVDRLGRARMAVAAAGTLALAGIAAAVADPESVAMVLGALLLLGLGWNFGLLSGTAMIVDSAAPSRRASIQGRVDLLIALSGSVGGASAGFVVASSSYAALSLLGGTISLLILVVVWMASRPSRA